MMAPVTVAATAVGTTGITAAAAAVRVAVIVAVVIANCVGGGTNGECSDGSGGGIDDLNGTPMGIVCGGATRHACEADREHCHNNK